MVVLYILIVIGLSYCYAFQENIEREVIIRFLCLLALITAIYNYQLVFKFIAGILGSVV